MERHLGLDVHAASCTLAVISQTRKRLKDFPVETNCQALVEAIRMMAGRKHSRRRVKFTRLREPSRSHMTVVGDVVRAQARKVDLAEHTDSWSRGFGGRTRVTSGTIGPRTAERGRRMRTKMMGVGLAIALATACSGGDPPAGGRAGETSGTGLQITHEKVGTGESPTASSVVSVHYHGTFPSGDVFDSSVDRGQPASFPLNRVIPCWTEALQRMKVGGKAKLVCPPGIAYGARGAPPRIPGDATLHFDVELLAIE